MIPTLFTKYPKIRAVLPLEFKEIYDIHYQRNRQGETKITSLSMRMERWLHKQVAQDVKKEDKTTLEIGAGTLNQLPYELNVKHYDIVEPFKKLYENSPNISRINTIYNNILDIDSKTKYQRITSIATFEHILDLPLVVAKAAVLLQKNGALRVSIPNEGSLLWKLGTLITGMEFKKMYGLDYQILLQYEHVNSADEIEAVLNYFFKNINTRVYGLNKRLSFYRFFACQEPDLERANEYLRLYASS